MSFPTTPVLDNFNRADSATTLGANWTAPTFTGDGSPGISTNQAYNPGASFADAQMTSAGTIVLPMEAYITAAVVSGTASTAIDYLISGTAGSRNGYRVSTINNTALRISKIAASAFTNILQVTQTVASGDAFGVSVDANSLHTIWYKAAAGSWTSIGTITDATFVSGTVGIGVAVAAATRVDDFGGGTVAATSTVVLPTALCYYYG